MNNETITQIEKLGRFNSGRLNISTYVENIVPLNPSESLIVEAKIEYYLSRRNWLKFVISGGKDDSRRVLRANILDKNIRKNDIPIFHKEAIKLHLPSVTRVKINRGVDNDELVRIY